MAPRLSATPHPTPIAAIPRKVLNDPKDFKDLNDLNSPQKKAADTLYACRMTSITLRS